MTEGLEQELADVSDALISEDERSSDNHGNNDTTTSKGLANCGWCRRLGWLKQELKTLFHLFIPITLSLYFQMGLLWVSLLFLGHLPSKEEDSMEDQKDSSSAQYAAAGLGTAFLNVSGIAIGHGIATAADTLSSQAYGFKNYKRVGVILQRGILIMGLILFPIWAVYLNTESILLLIHQSPCVAMYSAFYVKLSTLALPFIFLYILLQHYLQSQSIVWQFVIIGFISNIVSVILHTIFIFGAGLGFKGPVMALVISNTLPPLLVIVYVWYRKLHKETWGGWSFECLDEWGLFLKLAVPGLLMRALEWWSFEIVNFIAGAFSETDLAVNVVWFQILVIVYMPSIGLCIAVSVRVGNELGAGNPQGAKRASYVAMTIVFFISVVISIFFITTKDVIGTIFLSGNEEVNHKVTNLMYLGCAFVYFDQMQLVIGGVLRGSGRQYIGAIMNFVAYYIVGLPLGILLGFKTELQILGVWIGMFVGNILHCLVFVIVVIFTDWKKESEKAIKRSQGTNSEERETDSASALESQMVKVNNTSTADENTSATTSDTSSISSSCEDTEALIPEIELVSLDRKDEDRKDEEDSKVVINEKKMNFQRFSRHCKKILCRSSFLIIGIAVLIAGGISSNFTPHVDPDMYSNCSTSHINTNTSFNDTDILFTS